MQYGGDTNYSAAGFSTTHTIIARTIPVTIALSASPTSALRSQTIRLTVSTSAPDSTITPAISFSDNGLAWARRPSSTGIGQLDTNLLAVGTHTIAATYLGLTNSFAGTAYPTTTSLPVTVVISAVPTTTTLAASASTLTSGNPITLMAATTSTATTPFGSVSFYDGASLLGTSLAINGQASWATSFASTGDHSLTAVFQNNETFAGSTSAAVAVHSMTAAGAAPSSLALTVRDSGPTGSVSLVATLASVATRSELSNRQVGFFALTVSGAPSGVTINPASFTLSPAGTQTITIFAGLTVAAGASTLSISGASGSLHHSGTLALTLQAAPAGSLSRLKYVRTDSTLGADLSFFPQAHIFYSASSRRFFFADASLNRIHVFNAATEQKIGEVVVPGAYQLENSREAAMNAVYGEKLSADGSLLISPLVGGLDLFDAYSGNSLKLPEAPQIAEVTLRRIQMARPWGTTLCSVVDKRAADGDSGSNEVVLPGSRAQTLLDVCRRLAAARRLDGQGCGAESALSRPAGLVHRAGASAKQRA